MKKIICTAIVIFALIVNIATITKGEDHVGPAAATMYVNPATINATTAGQNFTVEICIDNVTDLYAWMIGLTWNSSLLECTAFEEGPFLNKSGGATLFLTGVINNTLGEIYPYQYACTLLFPATQGVNGSGTLATANFTAKAPGISNIHLAEISLSSSPFPAPIVIPVNMVGVFTVVVEDNPPFQVITVSNLTSKELERCRLYNYSFSQSEKMISFYVTSSPLTTGTGFCNVTIPKTLLKAIPYDNWTILLGDKEITENVTINHNASYTSLWFNYPPGTYRVQIIGTHVVPEFPTAIITMSLLLIITLAVAFLRKMHLSTKHQEPAIT